VTASYRGETKQQIANKKMKTRQIGIAVAALAVAGLWFGRLAWRAHHHLVTLHARNMPLAEVVRSLEWQTWEKIKYDRRLEAKITLNVKDAPFDQVLDLVADKAGARWQETFAVGASDGAMAKLELVLEGAEKLDAAGWTNLAPQFSEFALDNPPGAGSAIGAFPLPGRSAESASENPPGPVVGQESIGGGSGPEQIPRNHPIIVRQRMIPNGASGGKGRSEGLGGGAKIMFTSLPDGTTDQWSTERLVLETSLLSQLSGDLPAEATPESAAHVASSVHGRSRMYYALEKSPFEAGLMGGPDGGRTLHHAHGPPQPGDEQVALGGAIANMAQMARQNKLRELSRSPEEQVERARQHADNKMRFEIKEETQ
jgi:hypothetical protein